MNVKKTNDDVMPANSEVIVIFLIYSQFAAFQGPDSGHIVCKTYIFIKSNILSCKIIKKIKISNTALILLVCVKVLFLQKTAGFLHKNADISKVKRVLVIKNIFSETKCVCVLTYQNLKFLGQF